MLMGDILLINLLLISPVLFDYISRDITPFVCANKSL